MTRRVLQGSFFAAPRPAAPAQAKRAAAPAIFGAAAPLDPAVLLGLPRTGGQRLPATVQRRMESLFGADFSDVRVHSAPAAQAIGAAAFTMGPDIYFAPGRYQPETAPGRQLLAHELAHVLQQRSGRVHHPGTADVAIVRDRALEAEADRMGMRAAAAIWPARPAPAVQARLVVPPPRPALPPRLVAPPPHRLAPAIIQRSSYSLRSKDKDEKKSVSTSSGKSPAPSGYVSLAAFNSTGANKFGKYGGLKDMVSDETGIYVLPVGSYVRLWWINPAAQIDDFVYTGSSAGDIKDCNETAGSKSGHTWHHTGYPDDESYGTMQLVPTDEHGVLTHVGGSKIAYGN